MSLWLILGVALLVLAPVLIRMGRGKERHNGEPPQLVQYGYLSGLAGLFVLLVQFTSIALTFLLFVLLFGVIWAADRFYFKPRRTAGDFGPAWAEIGRGFFPVFLVVFVLRSFIAEPYQIPSSSMRPGLIVGDFILVNKFAYGLRMPVSNQVVIPVGKPARGDVMVFNFPADPNVNYIKRVIGLPGDRVDYRGKRLYINGKPVVQGVVGEGEYLERTPYGGAELVRNQELSETLDGRNYHVYQVDAAPDVDLSSVVNFPYKEGCHYDDGGFTCKVPQGHYFMLGDNRDHSFDGRYWGFVPEKYVVGKAFLVWLNLGELGRVGKTIN